MTREEFKQWSIARFGRDFYHSQIKEHDDPQRTQPESKAVRRAMARIPSAPGRRTAAPVPPVKPAHVHDFRNAEDYTGNMVCECGEHQ